MRSKLAIGMGIVVGSAAFLICCYATARSAIEAGRSEDRATRLVWLTLELILFVSALGLGFVAPVAVAGSNAGEVLLLAMASYVLGFGVAIFASYVEYAIRGRLGSFGDDLRSSVWLGRAGTTTPFGGTRRPR